MRNAVNPGGLAETDGPADRAGLMRAGGLAKWRPSGRRQPSTAVPSEKIMHSSTAAAILETVASLSSFRADTSGRLRRAFIPSGIMHKSARRAVRAGDIDRARQIMIDTLSILRSIDKRQGVAR